MPSQLFKTIKDALPPDFQVIEANAGDKLTLDVDVADMTIPYTVAFRADVVMQGFTDRKHVIELEAGVHSVGWNFQHTEKKWHHRLRVRVGNKSFVTWEERSEKKKDPPVSVGSAIVVVNAGT